jgi:hypothetical protein
MKSLEHTRAEYDTEGRRDMVLAVNYELASEATRTLLVIRKLEEIGGVFESAADVAPLRAAMQHFINLPGVPRGELSGTSRDKINALYDQHTIAEAARAEKAAVSTLADSDEVWSAEQIMSAFGIGQQYFDVKYQSYCLALKLSGNSSNWNAKIDSIGRERGILTESEIMKARTDFNQAVLNRIKLALAMERDQFRP